MNRSELHSELRELCDQLLDGEFGNAQRARLEELVLGDADARRFYVEYMHLNASLQQRASRLGDVSLEEVLRTLPEDPIEAASGHSSRWPLQIAAALAVAATAWWIARPSALATLVETNGARWESSSLPTETGSKLRAGHLRLADGIARIVFRSGAEISLEGPAVLELTGTNACFLHSGALVAHVPEGAKGFTVGTANARLIDHGTDFGISTDAAGRAQVQVLNGEVELQHGKSGEKLRLLTKESAQVTAERFTSGAKGEGEPDRYAFARTGVPNDRTQLSLTTAAGNGTAAYVVSPNSPIHFSDTLLLVKNAPTKSYLRKAYLKFDLASLRNRRASDATLTLNFEPTGFGYASLTGDCTFAVYGLKNDSADDWQAESLTWENAPAFAEDGGAVNEAEATKLGTFTTPRGVVSGAFSISGDALVDFINRDENRLATLIVVRETSVSANTSAVHGFAGNRHPTLAPPTLRLTLSEDR